MINQKDIQSAKVEELKPAVGDKDQDLYLIKDKDFSEIKRDVENALCDLTSEKNLNLVIQVRKQIIDNMKPLTDLINQIEGDIKAEDLPKGDYGFIATLSISYAKKTTVDEAAAFNLLRKQKLNPLNYAKLNTTSSVVKDLIKNHPEITTVDPEGTKRHAFK